MANEMNRLIIENFESLCGMYWSQNRYDLLRTHEIATKMLSECECVITPSKPILTVSEFDGVNTRNKVLKILQSSRDLDEVIDFKKHTNYHSIMNAYRKERRTSSKN